MPNRHLLLLSLLALLLTSCGPAPTRIALTIEYDDAWDIGLMEIRGNRGETERDVRMPAQHSLEIWVPDAWAGQEARIRVRGLHGSNDAIATGIGNVVPVLGTTTPLTITLHRVACGAWCTEGETRCFGDAVAACAQLDLDPCMEWAPSIPCPPDAPFCSLGQCRDECIDECAENEMRCDGPNGYQICGNFDGDSCREWSTTTTCGEGESCNSGTCTTGCRNQCTAGATQCRGSAIVTCGDLNDDGCTEWGPLTRCATGTCEGNRCVERCTNECEADECSGNTFHECGQFDADPCLDRSPGLSCTPADLCLDGMCHPTGCTSIARACDQPPAQLCVNTNTLRVYDAVGECTAGDCNYTSRDISCPNCPSCDACAGVTCNAPPAATCANSATRRTFAATGTCEAGSCDYSYTDTPCNTAPAATCANSTTTRTYAPTGTCSSGACSYSPIDTACNRPPAASCIDTSTLRTYMSPGNCSAGACNYVSRDISCPNCPSCDSCAGVTCNMPPVATCANASTRRTFASVGTCETGSCTYAPTDTPCNTPPVATRANSTTTRMYASTGTCSSGACSYSPIDAACNRPPAATCVDAATLRTYMSTGTCSAGTCTYAPIDTACPAGCAGNACAQTDGAWTTLAEGGPSARYGHSAVWTGAEMIVWGGLGAMGDQRDGSRFNPATNAWSGLETTNAPSERSFHTAIWTGTEMIIWGGSGSDYQQDGGRFNPATNTWHALDITNAPSARERHSAVWTGTEMIIWGGVEDGYLQDGGRFNPVTNTWSALNTTNAPSARSSHSAIWTGTEMIIWGGYDDHTFLRNGGRFNPNTNSWSTLSATNAPSGRDGHSAIWTGTEMIIWGGYAGSRLQDGHRFNPATNSWSLLDTPNPPSRRDAHSAVWTGTEMIIWGGYAGSFRRDGGRWQP